MERKREKNLIPSHKENRRYILFEGNKKDVENAILEYIGVLGFSKASPFFIKENIVAVNREEIEKVRASFIFKNIKILRVSGTIKGLNAKI